MSIVFLILWYNSHMNSDIYDDLAIEAMAKDKFGMSVDIKSVIVRSIPTGHTTQATVFLTTKNQLYCLISGAAVLTLGDVRTIIRRMGLAADSYLPPRNKPKYFHEEALERFRSIFPGRHDATDADLRYYRLLSPYNPGLVKIAEVPEGVIRQFDSSDSSNWRVAKRFQYRKIQAK